MVNVNILNNLIGGISKQIPLVHSYYTTSPYESWNTKEIQYQCSKCMSQTEDL